MAINKNDYLDGNGNYDLKKELVDELIDEINDVNNKIISGMKTITLLEGATGDLRLFYFGKMRSLVGRITNVPRGKTIANLDSVDRPPVNIDLYSINVEKPSDSFRMASWGEIISYASGEVFITVTWAVN